MTIVEKIHKKVGELPNEIQLEVLDFVDYLKMKIKKESNGDSQKHFNFDWEGKLKSYKKEFTSIELQHKSLEWR